jgi:hypothetical protein
MVRKEESENHPVAGACRRPQSIRMRTLLVAAIAGCLLATVPRGVATAATLRTYTDPAGFSVRAPAGWKVRAVGGAVVATGESATVVARPFLAPAGQRAADCARAASVSLGGLLAKVESTAVAGVPGRAGEATARLTFAGGVGSMLCHVEGRAAMAYAVAAPAKRFGALRPTMVKVLASLRFTPPATSAATGGAGPTAYVTFRDPTEGAFTVQVPKGWAVKGGLFRQSAIDVRPVVQVSSPAEDVLVTSGDTTIGFFTPPSPALDFAGFGEGSQYSPGAGQTETVLHYLPGKEFAASYLRSNIAKVCTGVTIVNSVDRPDIAGPINVSYQRAGLGQVVVSAGEISFTCTAGGEKVRGWEFAETTIVSGGAVQVWQVDRLIGYLASENRAAAAQAVANRLAGSFAYDAAWSARQQQTTATVSKIVAEANDTISRGITDSYWTRQRSNDTVFDNWSKAILGQTDVRDPATGETWRVEAGHNYYWRNLDGTTSAGDTAPPPDINVSILQTI